LKTGIIAFLIILASGNAQAFVGLEARMLVNENYETYKTDKTLYAYQIGAEKGYFLDYFLFTYGGYLGYSFQNQANTSFDCKAAFYYNRPEAKYYLGTGPKATLFYKFFFEPEPDSPYIHRKRSGMFFTPNFYLGAIFFGKLAIQAEAAYPVRSYTAGVGWLL
jgi:hypothetical protein